MMYFDLSGMGYGRYQKLGDIRYPIRVSDLQHFHIMLHR